MGVVICAFLAFAGLIVGVAVLQFSDMNPVGWDEPVIRTGAGFILAAGLLIGVALRRHFHSGTDWYEYNICARSLGMSRPDATPPLPFTKRTLRLPLITGLVCLGILTVVTVGGLPPFSAHLQMALLGGGCILVTWGLSGGAHFPRIKRWEALAVLSVTALAVIVRAWEVGDMVRWYVDEFLFADTAIWLHDNPSQPLLIPQIGLSSIVWVFPYFQTRMIDLFGADLTGLRFASVMVGSLTVFGTYLLARNLFDRRVAFIAACVLTTFPPHLHFSRLALHNIVDPLFGVFALAFLARALRLGGRGNYALAGLFLGLADYFYEGGRLLFVPLALAWVIGLFLVDKWPFARKPVVWRVDWRGVALMVLTMLLVITPLYVGFRATHDFQSRADQIGGFRLDSLKDGAYFWRERLRPPLLHFVYLPDASGWHYGGATPLLLAYTAPFALMGLFYLLWRPRLLASGLLLAWLALTVIGNSLLDYVTYTARYNVVFPALALLAAVGIDALWRLIFTPLPGVGTTDMIYRVSTKPASASTATPYRFNLPPISRRAWVTGTLVALIMIGQATYYFGAHIPAYNYQLRPYRDYIDVMYRARDLPSEIYTYVVPQDRQDVYVPHYTTLQHFLGLEYPITVIGSAYVSDEWLEYLAEQDNEYAFFIEPDDLATHVQLREHLTLEAEQFSPYNVPWDRQYILILAHGRGGDS
jgi:hypothetical protein